MAVAKIIICQVTDEKRQSFTHSQSQWGLTASCEGFIGQLGGWVQGECEQVTRQQNSDSYNQAVVIGLWQSQQGLTDFMGSTHDNIIEQNQQTSTYLGPVDLCWLSFVRNKSVLIEADELMPSHLSKIHLTKSKTLLVEPFGQRLLATFTALSPFYVE